MERVAKQAAVVQRSELLEASGFGSPQAGKPIKDEVCGSRPVPLGALPIIQHPSEIFGLVSIEVPKQPRPETPQTLRLTMPRRKNVKTHVGYSFTLSQKASPREVAHRSTEAVALPAVWQPHPRQKVQLLSIAPRMSAVPAATKLRLLITTPTHLHQKRWL